MHIPPKFALWLLPLLGFIFGIIGAYGFVHLRLNATWQFVGKPSGNISQIIGVVGNKLFISTDAGEIYSFIFYIGSNSLPMPIPWVKEEIQNIQPEPIQVYEDVFLIGLPAPFSVKQLYERYFLQIESFWNVKFALSENGNLWLWNAGGSGMLGITYYILPPIGIFIGGVLALLIKLGLFLWKK